MRHGKLKKKTLISMTFAFLLTLFFFVLMVCVGLGLGVFNNKSLEGKMNETHYYDALYEDLNKKAIEAVLQAGLSTTVLKDTITMERVTVGGRNYTKAILAGKTAKVDTTQIRSDLSEHMTQYLNDQGIEQTKEVKTGMDSVITRIEQNYQNAVKLPFIKYYVDYKTDYGKMMQILIPILILCIGILCYLLIRIRHQKYRGLRYINYAMISSSLLMLISAVYLLLSKEYTKLNVSPEFYKEFLTAYLKWDILVFVYIGGIGIVISVALISLTGFLKNRSNNR